MKNFIFLGMILVYLFGIFFSCKKEFKSPFQIALLDRNINSVIKFKKDFYDNLTCTSYVLPPPFGSHADYEVVKGFFVREINFGNDFNCDTLQSFSLKLILEGDSIIYYVLNESFKAKSNSYELIDSFKNERKLDDMAELFLKDFGADLRNIDLFKAGTYGFACGYDPIPTPNALLTDSLIKTKNISGIFELIKNPIPDKMLYGLYSLNELCSKGVNLSSSELNFLKNALAKKGNVSYCSGCTGGSKPIAYFTGDFKCLLQKN